MNIAVLHALAVLLGLAEALFANAHRLGFRQQLREVAQFWRKCVVW